MKAKLRTLLVMMTAFTLAFAMLGCTPPAEETAAPDTGTAATTDTTTTEPAAEAVELQIFAANSLEKALPEVQALYTEKHPEVTFAASQFKASGDLVEQLGAGATGDILITASKGSMDTAVEKALIDEATRADMFANDLIVVKAKDSDVAFSSMEDVSSDSISRIAIGDAATVPAGQYANQALNSIGLYSSDTGKDGSYDAAIEGKVVVADKVGTAANYVATGDCQVGFVYTSDLYRYEGIETAFTVPADAHSAILYPGAVLSTTKSAEVSADFLNFCLTDPEALQIWAEYGFELI